MPIDIRLTAAPAPAGRSAGCPSRGGADGSIGAALFLREFTGGRTRAHLDIAGAARFSPDGDEPNGAAGFGTRLLLRWMCDLGEEADAARAP